MLHLLLPLLLLLRLLHFPLGHLQSFWGRLDHHLRAVG